MEAALDELVNKLQLGAEQFETAALILRTESEAKDAARILKEKLENTGFDVENRFSYLHRDSTSFCKGLTVTTFYLAKGLEFDQVFSCSLQQIRARLQNRDVILQLPERFINCICTNTENKYYKSMTNRA